MKWYKLEVFSLQMYMYVCMKWSATQCVSVLSRSCELVLVLESAGQSGSFYVVMCYSFLKLRKVLSTVIFLSPSTHIIENDDYSSKWKFAAAPKGWAWENCFNIQALERKQEKERTKESMCHHLRVNNSLLTPSAIL